MLGDPDRDRDVSDEAIDGPSDILGKIKEKATRLPPFVTYGGLMGLIAIFCVMTYVFYTTFNSLVLFLLLISLLVFAAIIYINGDWRTAALGAFSFYFIFGLFIAYLNIRAWHRLDSALTPAAGGAIDERWGPTELAAWFVLQGIPHLAARFGLSTTTAPGARFGPQPYSGAKLLMLTEPELLRMPLLVSDGRERAVIIEGIRKGIKLHERRHKNGIKVDEWLNAALQGPLGLGYDRMARNG